MPKETPQEEMLLSKEEKAELQALYFREYEALRKKGESAPFASLMAEIIQGKACSKLVAEKIAAVPKPEGE